MALVRLDLASDPFGETVPFGEFQEVMSSFSWPEVNGMEHLLPGDSYGPELLSLLTDCEDLVSPSGT